MKPKTIQEYIFSAPVEVQENLLQLHDSIKGAAPGATEGLKWSMPAYSYQKILVAFALCKTHIGFYPMPSAVKAFAKTLAKYKTAEGSIQFPLNKPLPLGLIKKKWSGSELKKAKMEPLNGDRKEDMVDPFEFRSFTNPRRFPERLAPPG